MGQLLNIVTPLHKATKRDYLARYGAVEGLKKLAQEFPFISQSA